MDGGAWWATVHGVAKSRTRLSNFTFPFHFHASEKEMATHTSVLAWRIPGMGEPGGLPSMGSQRVGHDWSDLAAAAAYPFSSRSSWPRDQAQVSCVVGRRFTIWATAAAAKSLQSCPTLCDPIDGSPPCSPVPRILQERTLSRLPLSSPMHESEKWKWSHSVVSDS